MRVFASSVSMLSNNLLASLPQAEWDALRGDMRRARLVRGQQLINRGHVPEQVFFIEEGLASVVVAGPDGDPGVQVAMIGSEGMLGGLSLIGDGVATVDATMQFPGPALLIPVAALRARVGELPMLRQVCMGFIQSEVGQIMEVAAINARCTLPERCIRWLLMAHERIEGDDLPVTHEELSLALGVRRPGVTLALSVLQDAGLIRATRGNVRVLDRAGLMAYGTGRPKPARTRPRMPAPPPTPVL